MTGLFALFRRRNTAPIARERLQILLSHERVAGSGNHVQLIELLREEIIAVIARHMPIDRDKVQVKMDRGDEVNTLEIDVELPSQPVAVRA